MIIMFVIGLINIVDIIHYECPFKQIFHIYCAGCGITRMLKSMISLHFYQAFRYNPLMFIYLIAFGIYIIIDGFRYVKGKKLIKISFKIIIILVALALIYMVLRNMTLFSFLKPTKI